MLHDALAVTIRIEPDPRGLISWLIIGLIAGWLAGKITKGKGFGLLGNLIIGVLGAFLGGLLFGILGLGVYGFPGSLVMATVGALALLYVLKRVGKVSR